MTEGQARWWLALGEKVLTKEEGVCRNLLEDFVVLSRSNDKTLEGDVVETIAFFFDTIKSRMY